MKKIIGLFLFAGVLSASNAIAQEGFFSIQYTMGFGTGNTGDFISTGSFRGITFEYKKMVKPNLAVGVDGGWSVFYERRPYATYVDGNAALSGVQYRYQSIVPLFASASYYFAGQEDKIRPYAGLGVGTLFSKRELDMGLFYVDDESWHFAFRPETGIVLNASPNTDFMMNVRYAYGLKTNDTPAQEYVSIYVGAVFKIW
jgi:outer membrane protein